MFAITDDSRCYSDRPAYFVEADGWYIDDVRIQEAPLDVSLNALTNVTMHGADLSWSQNTEADFARYEVYRAKNADPTLASTLVATITNQTTTSFADTYTILQPDRYRYRMYVVDDLGRYSMGSNVVEAIYTVPQVSFPFFDNMESGTVNWNWGAPWGQVTNTAYSTTTSWADSPLGSYDNSANTSLTTFVSLAGASSPVLTFWHRLGTVEGLDFGRVEVSTDGGNSWTTVHSVSGNEDWNQERIDLNTYRGAVIGLRFRLQADASLPVGDGWYIDDVRIADSPVAAAYPFSDDVESGEAPWLFGSPWGLTHAAYHSTSTSWTDSPSGNYRNNEDTSLQISINLATAQMPKLVFWQRYSLEANLDFGYVEVSINAGATWNRVNFVTGASPEFVEERVDLTEYAGSSDVRVRFRLVSNASGVSDGWYIDDVSIAETAGPAIPYPFFDDLESSAANWITGSWGATGPAYSGTKALTDSPVLNSNYPENANSHMRLILASTIDLSGSQNPQLSFWHKHVFIDNAQCTWNREIDTGRVYVSDFFGQTQTWTQLASFRGSQSVWTQEQIDLSAYAGFPSVRVMFAIIDDSRCYSDRPAYFVEADGWYIDDVRIQEAPLDVSLNAVTNVTMHGADLSWSQNTEADFARYEVYRAKNADPTLASTLVATITNQTTTSFADTYTILQPDRYRYRVYVVDDLGRYSVGSNVVEAVYTVPQVAFPFFDNMEGGTGNWEWGAPWGQVTNTAYSTTTSWADSPLGSYDNNANTSLTTFVSLAGSGSPVLTFWHRLGTVPGQDFGRIEVSTDSGNTWTMLLSLSGIEDWNQERIDLNAYRGAVIGLRFRLTADAASVGDGWYIDNVRIADSPVAAAYPFSDDMESGLAPWLFNSPWGHSEISAHSGRISWTDSPTGNYRNNEDTSLRISVNLGTAIMPELAFWQRYSLEDNLDFGYVEVSINGGATWNRVFFVTAQSPTWTKERVDLTEYAGNSDVRVRFRLISGSSGVSDGWYVDDVSIAETAGPTIPYPFFDNLESSAANWITGSWGRTGPGFSGDKALTDSPVLNSNYPEIANSHMRLILASTIDLSGSQNPQLSFWHKHVFIDNAQCTWNREIDTGRVYVSTFFGQSQTWQQVASFRGTLADWAKAEIDLSLYAGFSKVRVMFAIIDDSRCYSDRPAYFVEADGWYIDDVRIDEVDVTAPAAITDLGVVSNTADSASLRWTAPGDDGTAGTALGYDVRYTKDVALTDANWDTATQAAGEPVPGTAGTIEDFAVTAFVSNATYYLGLKSTDEAGNASPLSNVVSVVTFAAGTVVVRIDSPTEVLGSTTSTTSTLDVMIVVDQIADFNAASYAIGFDPAVLQIAAVSPGLVNGTAIPVGAWNESPAGTVNIAQDLASTSTTSGAGHLAILTFNVIGATGTSSNITSTNEVLSDGDANLIPSSWTSDSVTVVDVLSGDANGDGVVNAQDITKIKRIIVKLDPPTPGADANHDGAINALDLTLIKRIIVGLN